MAKRIHVLYQVDLGVDQHGAQKEQRDGYAARVRGGRGMIGHGLAVFDSFTYVESCFTFDMR